jgi:acyl carrier protein
LELLIPQNISQVGVLKLDWSALQQFYPQLTKLPLVTHLTSEEAPDDTGSRRTEQAESAILQRLASTADEERKPVVELYLCEKVANVLRLPLSKIDVEQPLTALGLDSLMAIELKNRIELDLSVRIPIVTFLQGPSIAQFTFQLLDQLAEALPFSPPEPKASPERGVGGLSTKPLPDRPAEAKASRESDVSDGLSRGRESGVDGLSTKGTPTDEVSLPSTEELSARQDADLISMISQEDAQHLLAQLDQLSDREVDSLLNQIVQEEELH